MKNKLPSKIYIFLVFAFLYIPILVICVYSFNASNSTGVLSGFSLRWYAELFKDEATLTACYNTLILAITSSIFIENLTHSGESPRISGLFSSGR